MRQTYATRKPLISRGQIFVAGLTLCATIRDSINHKIYNLGRRGVHYAKMMQTMARTALLDGCGGRKGMGRDSMTADPLQVRIGLWGAARVQPIAALPTDNASWAGGARRA
jgi:hypothetical protein